MNDVDTLVVVDLVMFRLRALAGLRRSQPNLFSILSSLLSGKKNSIGLEVTLGGKSIGQYTLHFSGVEISHVEPGRLDPQVNHPLLGNVRIYGIIEQETLERALADQELLENPLSSIERYLPEITVKFLP